MQETIWITVVTVFAMVYVGANIWYGSRLLFKKGEVDRLLTWINKPGNVVLVAWTSFMLGIFIAPLIAKLHPDLPCYIFSFMAWPFTLFIMFPLFFTDNRKGPGKEKPNESA